jgi:hypothetical protein
LEDFSPPFSLFTPNSLGGFHSQRIHNMGVMRDSSTNACKWLHFFKTYMHFIRMQLSTDFPHVTPTIAKYGPYDKFWFLFWIDSNPHLNTKLLAPKFNEKCWHVRQKHL